MFSCKIGLVIFLFYICGGDGRSMETEIVKGNQDMVAIPEQKERSNNNMDKENKSSSNSSATSTKNNANEDEQGGPENENDAQLYDFSVNSKESAILSSTNNHQRNSASKIFPILVVVAIVVAALGVGVTIGVCKRKKERERVAQNIAGSRAGNGRQKRTTGFDYVHSVL